MAIWNFFAALPNFSDVSPNYAKKEFWRNSTAAMLTHGDLNSLNFCFRGTMQRGDFFYSTRAFSVYWFFAIFEGHLGFTKLMREKMFQIYIWTQSSVKKFKSEYNGSKFNPVTSVKPYSPLKIPAPTLLQQNSTCEITLELFVRIVNKKKWNYLHIHSVYDSHCMQFAYVCKVPLKSTANSLSSRKKDRSSDNCLIKFQNRKMSLISHTCAALQPSIWIFAFPPTTLGVSSSLSKRVAWEICDAVSASIQLFLTTMLS